MVAENRAEWVILVDVWKTRMPRGMWTVEAWYLRF